jgi:hypothetical protein
MRGRFRRKEPDISALQKVLGRFRRSTNANRRKTVVVLHGNAVRLEFVSLLTLLLTISLALWLRRRRRTREEEATFTSPPPEEVLEEAGRSAEEEVMVMPEGLPLAEDTTALREEPPPGEERPERRGIIGRRLGGLGWPRARWRRRGP